MANPSPNLTFVSSHVSAASLDSWMQTANGLRESGCTGVKATALNVV